MWRSCTRKYIFLTSDVFCHILPEKRHILAPGTKIFWTGRNVTIRLDWKMHFSSRLRFLNISEAWSGKTIWARTDPYAGRRTDFWDKKSSDFSGEFFRERNYCPRTAFSGKKILLDFKSSSNVLIWIESCWLPTREGNYCQNVFSSWKRRNTPRFRTLLFGKEAVKTFFYKCSCSGKMNPLHSQLMGTKL